MAYGTTKTEHCGAKKGKGASYERKADAKLQSRKGRRLTDKTIIREY